MEPIYFSSPDEFGKWLQDHHETATEIVVGFWKAHTGKPSLTWAESVREALRFGWIDGVRRRVDDDRYTIRFTPRKPKSVWSDVNVKLAQDLIDQGRMEPAGLAAFGRRDQAATGVYSHESRESRTESFPSDYEARFRAHNDAWSYWQAKSPSYRRAAVHWVMSAKQEATRERRLETLIADSAANRPIKLLARQGRA